MLYIYCIVVLFFYSFFSLVSILSLSFFVTTKLWFLLLFESSVFSLFWVDYAVDGFSVVVVVVLDSLLGQVNTTTKSFYVIYVMFYYKFFTYFYIWSYEIIKERIFEKICAMLL